MSGDEKSASQSVTGIVTSTPGTYSVRFRLAASMPGIAMKAADYAEVPVTVQPVIQP
ncbi:MAG: hypothetical protein AB7H96_12090 [Vicinamibacterales bacterium]